MSPLLALALLGVAAGQQLGGGLFGASNNVSRAVRSASLPLGVSQILFAPTDNVIGTNTEGPQAIPIPGFGGSIAWTPSTISYPRVVVGAPGCITQVNGATTYGAVYVYDSERLSFTLLQTLLPSSAPGSAGTDADSRFGITVQASQNSPQSQVSGGTNIFVGQPFATPKVGSPESIYFFSAAQTTSAGLRGFRATYQLRQTLSLSTTQTSGFGRALALSPDDQTLIVGAPGYSTLGPASSYFTTAGPTTGRVYVFQWVPSAGTTNSGAGNGAYTALAILSPSPCTDPSLQPAQCNVQGEVGFGVAVAMSGRTFAVGSLGKLDATGQPVPGIGNAYIYTIRPAAAGTQGATAAYSTAQFVQMIPSVPVVSAMSLSMTGNYLCIGVPLQKQVFVFLSAPVTAANPLPRYSQSTSVRGSGGMGQVVVATTIDSLLYCFMGQPEANIGAIFVSSAPDSLRLVDLGIQAGLEKGFGTSVAFNGKGNYMYAGNSLSSPHALVISLYFETLGKKAMGQRLISNDVQTAEAGVFSNFGSVVTGTFNSVQSIVAVGASISPTGSGRVYIYSSPAASASFSLQAVLVGEPGSMFGSAVSTMLSSGSDIAVIVGAPSTTSESTTAFVDIFYSQASGGIRDTTKGEQRLSAPPCIPRNAEQSCGANFGGTIVVDGSRIVVAAHNYGISPGTGRVYVYLADPTKPRSALFSLQQVLFSPQSELGFGVSLSMGRVQQAPNTAPLALAELDMPGAFINLLQVASMGMDKFAAQQAGGYPFNQPVSMGNCYVYVNTGLSSSAAGGPSGTGCTNCRPYSMLQTLVNAPVQLISGPTGSGSIQGIQTRTNDLYIGNVWRNEVRFYRYNGRQSYSLMQILRSPYGPLTPSNFGASLYATPTNRGLVISAAGNGTAFVYLNPEKAGTLPRFQLQRVLSARPYADLFSYSVSAVGSAVLVGAPGANTVSVYPLLGILELPMAVPSPPPSPVLSAPGSSDRPAGRARGSAAPTSRPSPPRPPRRSPSAPPGVVQPPSAPSAPSAPSVPSSPPPPSRPAVPSQPSTISRPTLAPSAPRPPSSPPSPAPVSPMPSSFLGFGGQTAGSGSLPTPPMQSPTAQPSASNNANAAGGMAGRASLSGGAVGGIVAGALALVFAGFFITWCTNRHKGDDKLALKVLFDACVCV